MIKNYTMTKLKEYRTRLRIKAREASSALGVSVPTIMNWESGKTSPPVHMAPNIKSFYRLKDTEWDEYQKEIAEIKRK